MGLLAWFRRRARVDPTDIGTAEDDLQVVRAADEPPPAGLAAACEAHPEVAAAYLFAAQRDGAGWLVLGLVLREAVSEERLDAIRSDLEARAQPLRVGVELLGPETQHQVADEVEPLFLRAEGAEL